MKFSEQWLREWVDPSVSTDELAAQLTMAGLEVDAVDAVAPLFKGIVVGQVLGVEPHPQADRLQLCQVNVGAAEPLTIVCGAANVRAGMHVPTACIGAVLPGGLKIKRTKLRGVASFGMLCSAKELGLAENSEGLMALPQDSLPGQDIRVCLQLDDVSIELGLTPNRSDCLSIAGIAREVATLNRCAVRGPVIDAVAQDSERCFAVGVAAQQACPRYLGRVITNINGNADTPLWMQERLRRSGLRSISPVVDVSNYVMLELGQPMHAFDLDKLSGAIDVRYAAAQERITLLDGQQLTLDEQTLVIADEQGPVALAGIMGGLMSAVGDQTRHLFLESAYFSPATIAGKARHYGLHTDSSHRFERGVDPELPRMAMERATALLVDIVGGEVGALTEVVYTDYLPRHDPITLRASRLQRILGAELPADEVSGILQRLGLDIVASNEQGWQVISPSFRFDIAIEADLIEEVARVHGYDRLPHSRPAVAMRIDSGHGTQSTLQRQRQRLVDLGYQEAITYSFIAEKIQRLLDPQRPGLALTNPISTDLSVMRTSLWPGLIQTVQYNLNRQHKRIRLFESGVRFIPQGRKIVEESVIAGALCGDVLPEQWGVATRPVDFFDLKGDIEILLATTGRSGQWRFEAADHAALHPGQSARIVNDKGDCLGWLGQLHPHIAMQLSVDADVYLFELTSALLADRREPVFHELSRFPAIRRDLSVIVDQRVTAQQMMACVAESAGDLLQHIQIFDVYTGKGVDSGRKSLAIGLTIQEFSRTLTDEEVDVLIAGVIRRLGERLGATLRE